MKNILILCLLLSGCATTAPVAQKFPDSSDYLQETCPKLDIIDKPEVTLSEFIKTVVKNYTKYHECADRVNAWQEWYKKQKDISDKANP